LLPFWGEGLSVSRWVLLIPIVISFVVFSISLFAETNRTPFDLPECETELVAGYHTEYSSMKFALFFLGEYAAMIIGSGLAVTLFFGGWSIPFGPVLSDLTGLQFHFEAGNTPFYTGLLHIGTFFAKVIACIIFFVWVRWTLPRFRFDQLMKLGWLVFFEVALLNVFLTALLLWWVPLK
jgi:NADH-quinone oxidoreductase subunit H